MSEFEGGNVKEKNKIEENRGGKEGGGRKNEENFEMFGCSPAMILWQ